MAYPASNPKEPASRRVSSQKPFLPLKEMNQSLIEPVCLKTREPRSLTPEQPFLTMLSAGSLAQWKSSGLLIRWLQVQVLHDPKRFKRSERMGR
jgi:hypothetical protein